jgi:hypothetical protein
MQLNLPMLDQLLACKNFLIAGAGGGFDIFCGLPIYFELRRLGQRVHLANYSFSDLSSAQDSYALNEGLIAMTASQKTRREYFPEFYLSEWFKEQRGEDVTIWCFAKTGVRPLLDSYMALIEYLEIDGILLIDGGVDSLLHGDEKELGSILEDSISLCAVNELKNIALRMIACIGFGAERDVSHKDIYKNIAALSQANAYFGTCALISQMEAYSLYKDAVDYVHDKPGQDPSVINSSIISAVQGHYGNYHLTHKTRGSKLDISALMSIYWMFDLAAVAKRNLLVRDLRWTDSFNDAMRAGWKTVAGLPGGK